MVKFLKKVGFIILIIFIFVMGLAGALLNGEDGGILADFVSFFKNKEWRELDALFDDESESNSSTS